MGKNSRMRKIFSVAMVALLLASAGFTPQLASAKDNNAITENAEVTVEKVLDCQFTESSQFKNDGYVIVHDHQDECYENFDRNNALVCPLEGKAVGSEEAAELYINTGETTTVEETAVDEETETTTEEETSVQETSTQETDKAVEENANSTQEEQKEEQKAEENNAEEQPAEENNAEEQPAEEQYQEEQQPVEIADESVAESDKPQSDEPELYLDGSVGTTKIQCHEHTADCFDESENAVCGYKELVEHIHSDENGCFKQPDVEATPVAATIATATVSTSDETYFVGIKGVSGEARSASGSSAAVTAVYIVEQSAFEQGTSASNDNIAYCLNIYKDFPTNSFSGYSNPDSDDKAQLGLYEKVDSSQVDSNVVAVIANGYPNDSSGINTRSDGSEILNNSQFRYVTQLAVWYYTNNYSGGASGIDAARFNNMTSDEKTVYQNLINSVGSYGSANVNVYAPIDDSLQPLITVTASKNSNPQPTPPTPESTKPEPTKPETNKVDLTLSKSVTGIDNLPENLSVEAKEALDAKLKEGFAFTINLKDDKGNPATGKFDVTSTGSLNLTSLVFDADGNATVKLTNGDSIRIKDIPEGYNYIIQEEENASFSTEISIEGYVGGIGTVEWKTREAKGEIGSKDFEIKYVNKYTYEEPEPNPVQDPDPEPKPDPDPKPTPDPTPTPEPTPTPDPTPTPEPTPTPTPTPTPPSTPSTTTRTTTTTTTTTNNTTVVIEPASVPMSASPVSASSTSTSQAPEYEAIEDDPVPMANLTTLIEEDVPLAVITGDNFNKVVWSVLFAGSAFVIIFILAVVLKEKKRNQNH